uniref:Putative conserved secreted protein n=1 Tax=Anopheles darlingi TaxID=43151 RepID=A0A2M4DIB3_ANODA
MRLLVVLNLVLLVQVCLGGAIVPGPREDSSSSSHSSDGSGVALTRRKRGWGWSSSPSNQVTKRPIGWSFGDTQEVTVKPKKTNRYTQSARRTTASPAFYHNVNVNVHYGRPTKSLGRELVKAALIVGAAGAVKAYSKPATPAPMTAKQRAEARERRRQERLARHGITSTPIVPVTAAVVEGTAATTAVPLANSELIPVMMQDENKLLHIVYVPRDKIPPGGIPIATSAPFPGNPGAGGQLPPAAPPVSPQQSPVGPVGQQPVAAAVVPQLP